MANTQSKALLSYSSGLAKRAYIPKKYSEMIAYHSPFFKALRGSKIKYPGGGEPAANESSDWTPKVYFSALVRGAETTKTVSGSGYTNYPDGIQALVKQASVPMLFTMGAIAISQAELDLLSKANGDQVFGDILELQKRSNMAAVAADIERQLFSATLGNVIDIPDSTHIDVDCDKYFRRGMKIDTYAGTVQGGDSLTVNAFGIGVLPRGQLRLTMSAVTGITIGDAVYREDAHGNEGDTLNTIISNTADGNPIYGGLSATLYDAWGALVIDAGGATFDPDTHMIDPITDLWRFNGGDLTHLWVDYDLIKKYARNHTMEIRRLMPDGNKLPAIGAVDLGYKASGLTLTHPMTGREIKIMCSPAVTKGTIFGINIDEWGIVETKEMTWAEGTNGIWTPHIIYDSTTSTVQRMTSWDANPVYRWVPVCIARGHTLKVKNVSFV